MKIRISKHGKYEIREGAASEFGDSLEPGDLLTTLTADGKPIDVEVINPITNDDEFNEAITKLPAEVFIIVALARATVTDFYALHPYLVRCLQDGEYNMWLSTKTDSTPVKIKHPLHDDEPITADKVDADTITADKVLVDGAADDGPDARIPRKPGLYVDNEGAFVRFFFIEGSDVLHYIYVVVDGAPDDAASAYPVTLDDCCVARYAPFIPVRSFKNIEVES